MSAKIKIETNDEALSAALQIAIGEALQKHGFANCKSKIVMIRNSVKVSGSFDKASVINVEAGTPRNEPVREDPILDALRYSVPVGEEAVAIFINDIEKLHPGIKEKPIVLDGFSDTCENYEKQEAEFLGKN